MPYEWVSVHEASRRLGRSVSTIRRQIESGELVGEREPLARGSNRDRYRVRLDAPETPDDATSPSADDAPADTMRLLDMLSERDATVERLHGELLAATERAVRAEAERDATRETVADLRRRLEAAEGRLARRSVWKPWTWYA